MVPRGDSDAQEKVDCPAHRHLRQADEQQSADEHAQARVLREAAATFIANHRTDGRAQHTEPNSFRKF
jgi:hypothetical protein